MSSPINTPQKSIVDNPLLRSAIDKGVDIADVDSVTAKATQEFAKVAAKYASDGASKQGATTGLSDAPDIEQPKPGAIRDALKEVDQRSKGGNDNTASAKQPQAEGKMQQPRAEGKTQTRATHEGSSSTKTGPGKGDFAPSRASTDASYATDIDPHSASANDASRTEGRVATGDSKHTNSAKSADTDDGAVTDALADTLADPDDVNQETKFTSRETKSSSSRGERTQRNPQQMKAVLQKALATDSTSVADAQLTANAVQANRDIEKEDKLADSSSDKPMTNAATLGLLLGKLLDVLDDNSVEKMLANMQQMTSVTQTASDSFQAQADAISDMQAEQDQLNSQLNDANATLQQLQAASDSAAAAAAAANPPSADLQAKADAAAAAVTTQQGVVSSITNQMATNLGKLTDANVQFYADLSSYNASTSYSAGLSTLKMQQDSRKTSMDSQAQMTLIMAEFMNTLDENNLADLAAAQKKNDELTKAQAADEAKQASDATEQQKKSEAMGCVMKIITAIVMAVSTIAAIFTGGASLVLAAASLALMATDKILAATGHQTITGGIMDKIIKPMMDAIANAISDVLKGVFGDQPWVDAASQALGAIVTAVAIVALVAVGVKAAGSQLAKVAGDAIGSAIKDSMPAFLKSLGSAAEKSVGKMISPMIKTVSDAVKVSEKTLNTIDTTAKVARWGGSAAGTGVSIAGSVYNKQLNSTLADMQFGQAMTAQFGSMLTKDQMDLFQAIQEFLAKFQETMSGIISADADAGKAILKNMSRA